MTLRHATTIPSGNIMYAKMSGGSDPKVPGQIGNRPVPHPVAIKMVSARPPIGYFSTLLMSEKYFMMYSIPVHTVTTDTSQMAIVNTRTWSYSKKV